jgi:hypothetical protein
MLTDRKPERLQAAADAVIRIERTMRSPAQEAGGVEMLEYHPTLPDFKNVERRIEPMATSVQTWAIQGANMPALRRRTTPIINR